MVLNMPAMEVDQIANSFRTLSNPLRLKIVCSLCNGEQNVNQLVAHVGTSQSNISQHLSILSRRGILASRKDMQHIYYRLNDQRIQTIIHMIGDVFCHRRGSLQ